MVFLRPLKDLEFTDIERLKANKICESPILDYKEQLLEDNKLLKQVSAFANTQGGFRARASLEIHRNGCIHYMSYFGGAKEKHEEKILFLYHIFCIMLLHTLQFSSILYRRHNYFGDVRITCNLKWVKESLLPRLGRSRRIFTEYPCQTNEINIIREFPVNILESKYEYVASGIMDEIFNNYGIWKCPLFDNEGNFKESLL